jgi:hypothetical protein
VQCERVSSAPCEEREEETNRSPPNEQHDEHERLQRRVQWHDESGGLVGELLQQTVGDLWERRVSNRRKLSERAEGTGSPPPSSLREGRRTQMIQSVHTSLSRLSRALAVRRSFSPLPDLPSTSPPFFAARAVERRGSWDARMLRKRMTSFSSQTSDIK